MSVRLAVELAVQTVDPYGWDAGEWDVADWATPVGFVDVSCDAQGAYIIGGRNGPMDRFRAALATIRLDNRAGHYNSWSDATPWAPPGSRHLGAGTGVRVGVDVDGSDRVYLFTGKASSWHHRRDPPDQWVELTADDVLASFTLADLPEQPSQGAGEAAGARLERIIAQTGLQVDATAFDAGVVGLQATTLAQPAVTEADLTADSDGGWLWVDGAGTLRYYQADRDTTDPRWLTPVVTLTDRDDVPGAICWDVSPELDDDADAVVNHVQIGNAGGAVQVVDDLGSQYRYGVRTFQRHDLIATTDTHAAYLAQKIVDRSAAGGTRPGRVAVTGRDDPTAAAITALLWHDRIRTVVHDVGDVFTVDSFLDSYEWTAAVLGDDRRCLLTLAMALSPATAYITGGRWDAAAWDTDLWGY
jgi:hypothetical protein